GEAGERAAMAVVPDHDLLAVVWKRHGERHLAARQAPRARMPSAVGVERAGPEDVANGRRYARARDDMRVTDVEANEVGRQTVVAHQSSVTRKTGTGWTFPRSSMAVHS